jgi:hypothetical protein
LVLGSNEEQLTKNWERMGSAFFVPRSLFGVQTKNSQRGTMNGWVLRSTFGVRRSSFFVLRSSCFVLGAVPIAKSPWMLRGEETFHVYLYASFESILCILQ